MSTVITVSPTGEVRIEVGATPTTSPPLTLIDLARALHTLQQRHDRTDQLIKVLDAKTESVYRLVRTPTTIVLRVGTPTQES